MLTISLGGEGNVLYPVLSSYFSCRLAKRRRYCDARCVSVRSTEYSVEFAKRLIDDLLLCVRRAATARRISLGGEGNALSVLATRVCGRICWLSFSLLQYNTVKVFKVPSKIR